MDISNGFVVLMGVSIVFTGLVSIIILCWLMGLVLRERPSAQKNNDTANASEVSDAILDIPDKQQFVAAVSAVIAEELGKDISAIRIHSIKKI